MGDVTYRKLITDDLPQVNELMATDTLRPEGVLAPGTSYWGAFDGDFLIGMVGCEYENGCGLVRSALVRREYRGRGLMQRLTGLLLDDARSRDLQAVYLFCTDAAPYWIKAGFQPVSVTEAAEKLPHAPMIILFAGLGWLPTEKTFAMYLK